MIFMPIAKLNSLFLCVVKKLFLKPDLIRLSLENFDHSAYSLARGWKVSGY